MAETAETIRFDLAFGLGPFRAQTRLVKKGFTGIEAAAGAASPVVASVGQSFTGIGKGIGAAASGAARFAAPLIALAGVGGIFASMNQMMPFLGQGFQQMGVVIRNNLLWPLTQELLPIMIRLMNWVRDNRAAFVKMGVLILNTFRVIASIVTGLFQVLKKSFTTFIDAVTGGSFKGIDSFSKFINFILVKTALILNFVLVMIEPIFVAIGKLAAGLWNNILSPFLDGFFQGFDDLIGPMESVLNLIKRIVNDISGFIGGESSEAFMILGRVIGNAVLTVLERMIALAETIWDIFSGFFKEALKGLKSVLGKKGMGGLEKNLEVLTKLSGVLFWKIFIPFLRLAIPLARGLGRVLGTSIGNSIMVVTGAIRGLVRVFRFFTDDLPNAFRALPQLLLSAWEAITKKLRAMFVDIIRPFLKMIILIEETAHKLGILRFEAQQLRNLRAKLETSFPELKEDERKRRRERGRRGATAPIFGPSLAMAGAAGGDVNTTNNFSINVSGPGAAEQANRFVEIRSGLSGEEIMRRRARRGLKGSGALG